MRDLWRKAGAYIALALVILIVGLLQPEFRQPSNLLHVLDQSVEIAVVAVGMTAIILTGGIDLSVGSVAALAPFLGALVMTQHSGALGGLAGTALGGLLVALGVGALVGAANGLAITRLRLPPFIATLGMMTLARGLVFIVSHGTNIASGIPPGYLFTGRTLAAFRTPNGATANLTLAVLVMALVFLAGHVLLSRTRAGRRLYAIGGNETATRLSGVNVNRAKLCVYIVGGLLAALGGLIETATVGAAVPDAGGDLELNAIAAVVIGGTSLSGGRGSLAGTFAGALLMRTIRNGLNLINVDSNWQKVAIGLIIMAAVAFDTLQKKETNQA